MAGTKTLGFRRGLLVDGRTLRTETETVTGTMLLDPAFSVATSTTFSVPSSAFTVAKLSALSLYSDVAVAVTFASGGTPTTINLTAGAARDWAASQGACPIADNCTGISVVNATTSTASVQLHLLVST